MIEATSGFHQVSKLLTTVTNMGGFLFTVMAQGVYNSSSLWNILTDSNSHIASELAEIVIPTQKKSDSYKFTCRIMISNIVYEFVLSTVHLFE